MNFNNCDSFDELNPRAAPAPESFAAAAVPCVPEVSLVFGTSPLSGTHLNKKSSLRNVDNVPNLFANSRVTEKQIRDVPYKELQKERLEERYGRSSIESVSNLRSSKIQGKIGYTNDKSVEYQDVTASQTMPSIHIPDSSGAGKASYLTDVHETKSHQFVPNYRRHETQSVNAPLAFQGSCSYSTASKARSRKIADINAHNDVYSSRIVKHCSPEGGICTGQILERSHEYVPNRHSHAAVPFDYYSHDKQQCCPNHNKFVLTQDIVSNKSTSNVHGSPISQVQQPHSNACKYRSCCVHEQCVETGKEFDNRKVHGGHSGGYMNPLMTAPNKCNEYNDNFCENNGVASGKRNTPTKEDVIRFNAMQNKCKLKENSKDMIVNKERGGCYIGVEDSYSEVKRQDGQWKRNYDSVPKTSPERVGNSDKKYSDTSILQEIALMNHKQCSILQGLLQQVVVMQADQMKILSEINEKLGHNSVSEDIVPSKQENNGTPKIFSKKEDAATQTTIIETEDFCCRRCDDGSEIAALSDVKNSSKNSCTDLNKKMNEETKNMSPQNHGQENEQNKAKKFQDRAVSWSAVRGVETVEESFTLHGVCVPTVVEQLPSSIHTMHLHVQDYHSSASFESIKESRHTNTSSCENGQDVQRGSWTLYDNIVGHVKKFLHTVPYENGGNSIQKTSQMEAIRFATIEKIRQLGVSVYENSTERKEGNAPGKIHFDSNVASQSPYPDSTPAEKSRSDGSMELQALALKYLQDEDLSDLVKWNQGCKTPSILKTGQKSANISLATQHYLEKYQLLPTDYKDRCHNNAHCGQIHAEDNILDITTLKKQPKLL